MKLQVFDRGDGRYIALQKQRLEKSLNGNSYETVQVGEGFARETPDGTPYIDLRIKGFNDNKPKK